MLVKELLDRMFRTLLIVFLVSCYASCVAQGAQRVMLSLQTDVIKSDNDGFFEKIQGGLEGSYYFSRKFAVTGGLEWWSRGEAIGIAGVRICPIDEAFIRIRGLFNEDFSFGGGFTKPLGDQLRLEAMADYYGSGHIAIRAGIAIGFGARP